MILQDGVIGYWNGEVHSPHKGLKPFGLVRRCVNGYQEVDIFEKLLEQTWKKYPPGNEHIPPWEKENHRLKSAFKRGYVTSLEGII